jgi:hypothetical protein
LRRRTNGREQLPTAAGCGCELHAAANTALSDAALLLLA